MLSSVFKVMALASVLVLFGCVGPVKDNSAAQQSALQDGRAAVQEVVRQAAPWRDNEIAVAGEADIYISSANGLKRYFWPFAVRIYQAGPSLVSQLAIATTPDQLSSVVAASGYPNKPYLHLRWSKKYPFTLAEIRPEDGRLVTTDSGPVTLFPAMWSARLSDDHLNNMVLSNGSLNTRSSVPVAIDQLIAEGKGAIEQGFLTVPAIKLNISSLIQHSIERELEAGLYILGEQAYEAADGLEAGYNAEILELMQSKGQLYRVFQQAHAIAHRYAANYLLKEQCGDAPTGGESSVFGQLARGRTVSQFESAQSVLNRVEAYYACAENVRTQLEPVAYEKAWQEIAPLITEYAKLGGEMKYYYGDTLNIRGMGFAHPNDAEMPIDMALAKLAGEDFSSDRQKLAEQQANARALERHKARQQQIAKRTQQYRQAMLNSVVSDFQKDMTQAAENMLTTPSVVTDTAVTNQASAVGNRTMFMVVDPSLTPDQCRQHGPFNTRGSNDPAVNCQFVRNMNVYILQQLDNCQHFDGGMAEGSVRELAVFRIDGMVERSATELEQLAKTSAYAPYGAKASLLGTLTAAQDKFSKMAEVRPGVATYYSSHQQMDAVAREEGCNGVRI